MCDEELLNRFISCNIKRSDISLIAAVIAKLEDARVLCSAFDGIDGLLRNRTTAYQYEREWATALGRLLESPMVEKERKNHMPISMVLYASGFYDLTARDNLRSNQDTGPSVNWQHHSQLRVAVVAFSLDAT
jgi:hypothetical protein